MPTKKIKLIPKKDKYGETFEVPPMCVEGNTLKRLGIGVSDVNVGDKGKIVFDFSVRTIKADDGKVLSMVSFLPTSMQIFFDKDKNDFDSAWKEATNKK